MDMLPSAVAWCSMLGHMLARSASPIVAIDISDIPAAKRLSTLVRVLKRRL